MWKRKFLDNEISVISSLALMLKFDQRWRDTFQAYPADFLWFFFLRTSSSQLMNNRLKISRIFLTIISIQMDQTIAQTDVQLVMKLPTFQAIRKFSAVISIALFLHQSCVRWIQSTLFCLISVQPRFKLFSHLHQYITHGLFIQFYARNALSIVSLSYMHQLHPLNTLLLFLSPKKYLPKIKSHHALHYIICSSHLPPNTWRNVTPPTPYFLELS